MKGIKSKRKLAEQCPERIIKKNLCTNCGTCIGVCPRGAVAFKNDEIIVDKTACTSCGECINVCPGGDFDFPAYQKALFYKEKGVDDRELGHYIGVYRGFSHNKVVRAAAASGGVVTEFLCELLEGRQVDGAVVVVPDSHNPARFTVDIARSREEILAAVQSKYTFVPMNEILKEIKKYDGKYAFVGLPCQIQGLRKAMEADALFSSRIFFVIGLFCGFQMKYGGTKYLIDKSGIPRDAIKKIEYRAKRGRRTGFRVVSNDGGEFFVDKHEYTFLNLVYTMPRCLKCYDFTAEFSDVSIGDAWEKEAFSRIVTRTGKSDAVVEKLKNSNKIFVEESNKEDIMATQGHLIRYKKYGVWRRKRLFLNFPRYNVETYVAEDTCGGGGGGCFWHII
ncbi:MAG: Coenzyme F420 hydrogenase/dehydrogenase, beta subunit C-terminal domain [Bacteroidales bacterium]|jgi:coenzyme F420 hydrogenase subunit beta|nr:Coenzyme F420 hydrogenase/dehydrogenase, beta subunit C-terminal domain [Bacteroidales bacterium]